MDGQSPATLARVLFPEFLSDNSSSSSPLTQRRARLSLVLPAYNEEAGIRQAVLEACAALAGLTDDYEVLIVDDGSRDATSSIVAVLAADRPQVRLLRHECNRGYGAALRTGFTAARFEYVAFTDADCQFHLADLARMLPLAERFPLVVGWRQGRQDPWRRRVLSRGYNLLTRTLLGTRVRDCDCALKVFQRRALAALLPETNTFFVNAEMLTKACQLGWDVAEVGVRHRPRLRGKSTVSLREVPRIAATLLPFWWSRVVFAGEQNRAASVSERSKSRSLTVAARASFLLLLAGMLFFLRLRAPLLEPQEPRYAEIPRQMLAEGRWLVPVLHGQAYLDKPPLLYWLLMGSYSMFGVHDWAARLIPGLAGVLTVLMVYLWGRRVAGERAGLCGALVLCLSAGFIYRQRMLNMDSLICLWVTAALAYGHVALVSGPHLRWRLWLISATACGLGLLTKGPVALVLILTPMILYSLLEPRCARVSIRDWLVYVFASAALAAPWYMAVMLRMPDFAHYFFWRHHVERFLAPFDHDKPAWYYPPGLFAGMLPWTLLLPGFCRYLCRRSLRAGRRRPSALGFFLLCALWCLLFFSLSGCKRPAYILPAMPAFALALGCYVNALVPRVSRSAGSGLVVLWRWRSRIAGWATLLVLMLSAGILILAGVKRMLDPGPLLLLASLTATALVFFARRRVSWGICGTATFVVLALGVYHLQPAYNHQFAIGEPIRSDNDLRETTNLPVACYPRRWDSVSFYLPQADVRAYAPEQRRQLITDLGSRPQTLLVAKSGKALDELLRELPATMEFVPRGQPGFLTAGWVRPRPGRRAYRGSDYRPLNLDPAKISTENTFMCSRGTTMRSRGP